MMTKLPVKMNHPLPCETKNLLTNPVVVRARMRIIMRIISRRMKMIINEMMNLLIWNCELNRTHYLVPRIQWIFKWNAFLKKVNILKKTESLVLIPSWQCHSILIILLKKVQQRSNGNQNQIQVKLNQKKQEKKRKLSKSPSPEKKRKRTITDTSTAENKKNIANTNTNTNTKTNTTATATAPTNSTDLPLRVGNGVFVALLESAKLNVLDHRHSVLQH